MRDAMLVAADADPIAEHAATLICAAGRVLELGTRRSDPTFPTHHRAWAPDADYVMADVAPGVDVDVVIDAHHLTPSFEPGSFDAVIAVAVWEHLARPWIAAAHVADVLASGGIAYVSTHQTFPLHGYPNDYFRFSTEALSLLFTDAGLEEVRVGYEFPAKIVPPVEVTRWNELAPAWLNVTGIWRKP